MFLDTNSEEGLPSTGMKRKNGSSLVSNKKTKARKIDDEGGTTNYSHVEHWADCNDTSGPRNNWQRVPAPPLDPTKDTLVFQQVDIDYYLGSYVSGMPGNKVGSVPIIRIYGVTEAGNSAMINIHGYLPYFFVRAPIGFSESECEQFRSDLNARMSDQTSKPWPTYILEVRMEYKESIQGYKGDTKSPFLRIILASPTLVVTARNILEGTFSTGRFPGRSYSTFESNIAFVLRYMIDADMVGCNWIELRPNTYRFVQSKSSRCQYELDVSYKDVISHSDFSDEKWSRMAPMRILSFDIECAGRKGVFPEPEHDPVIQIANYVTVQGESKPIVKNIFCLKQCSPIVGSDVRCYKTEAELLRAWKNFVVSVDPDLMTGYNIVNFDLYYIVSRARALKVNDVAFLGRITNNRTIIRDKTFSSKQLGKRDGKEINLHGRVNFDMLPVIQRDHKLRSYTLNAVSAHFLGKQKEDVHHSIIADLQNGTNETRRRLAVYCLKDALLPQKLIEKLMCVINYVEMARVTGVPLNYLLTRGQQIKVLSQLYRYANEQDLLIPYMKSKGKQDDDKSKGYQGATVIKPKKAYYTEPIATLDFSSLYPSIMMAHNLCYTTLIHPQDIQSLSPDEYEQSPCGHYYVKAAVKKGLLPSILENLLSARKNAKRDMNNEKDPFKKAVFNGRQLALKISANSVYGFTGASVGALPCLEISSSVTAYGRDMIQLTRKLVLEKYTLTNGYSRDADVIYGDTDSVMVNFGVKTVAEAMELGREAAEYVTSHFQKPINLEFEKVYYPYLLMKKKRYAGLYWTKPDKYDFMDAKGIEVVRRDNCRIVKSVVQECLNRILIDRDVDSAVEHVKQIISDLLCNRLDLSLLVISKALSRKSEDYAVSQAHVKLAERMKKRDPGTAPAMGDRVPYVIIKATKGTPNYDKAEDPLWVLEHNIPLDTQYYLDKQLGPPIIRIFKPILKNPKSLLQGDHTRKLYMATPSTGGIVGWTTRALSCLGCKRKLTSNETSVCRHCMPKKALIYSEKIRTVHKLEREFASAWTQCQRCQGSFHETVLCTSRDCPIFYMRKKIQKDLDDAQEIIDRFDQALSW